MTTQAARVLDPGDAAPPTDRAIAAVEAHAAHNYHPLPVVLARGEGAWVEDVDGRRYLDMLAGYSALNFGHRHPRLVAAAERQLGRLTLTSRAFHNDLLGTFAAELSALCGMDAILPMNTGAEAVETAHQDGPQVGLRRRRASPRAGRRSSSSAATSTAARPRSSASRTTRPRAPGFGPYTPGFVTVPYGDADGARGGDRRRHGRASSLEPIQGEAGVIIPPDGFLREVRRLCTEHDVLMLADEIQSGLGRTGDDVRLRPRGRRARRVHPGQGAGRRDHAGVGGRGIAPT